MVANPLHCIMCRFPDCCIVSDVGRCESIALYQVSGVARSPTAAASRSAFAGTTISPTAAVTRASGSPLTENLATVSGTL